MRINVYSQELTSEVIELEKESNTGRVYKAAQLILHSSPMLHQPPEDDDRSAVTFWLPGSAHRREEMAQAFERIAAVFRGNGEPVEQHHAVPAGRVPEVVTEVLAELDRAMRKFPTWPTDPLHAVAVLNEECGELNKAVLQQVYEPAKNPLGAVHSEAVQAAAMALRFIASINEYAWLRSVQYKQPMLAAAPQPGEPQS